MPSATLDLATSTIVADKVDNLAKPTAKPITTTSAVPPVLGEVRSIPLALPFLLLYTNAALVRLSGL
jgi:hypothetical protein